MKRKNISSGTYNHCSNCKIKKNCCCDFDDEIDNIVTTVAEKEKIIGRLGTSVEKYFRPINEEAFNILNIDSVCPFYKNGCSIYDIRPSDCKLFPYDLKEIDGKYFLIKYNLPCGSKNVNENVDAVVKELLPIITTYTDKKIEEKVNNLPFDIIKEIKI
ncbi:MAG: YkgJ family cysteine cluster protein [Clostridia bacterium]|nr:YkgJ family cysteine cluster protein [Clostridia bacterium]